MHKELLTSIEDLFVVRGFLSSEECERHIATTEGVGYGDAPINTFSGPQINKKMRNNDSGRSPDVS